MENQNPQGTNPQGGSSAPTINIDNLLDPANPFAQGVENGEGNPPANPPANPKNPEYPATPDNTLPPGATNTNPFSTPGEAPNDNEDENPPMDDVQSLLSGNDAELSVDDKSLKYSILNRFKASSVDTNGNLVNLAGQVVLTKEALDDYIDNGNFIYDKDGNAINELGEVLIEAKDLNSSSIIDLTRKRLEEEVGFSFKDKEGKDIVYSNDVEGTLQLINDVSTRVNVSAVSSFLNNNPQLKDIFYHLQSGKDIKEYISEDFDYSSVDLKELDRDSKLKYIKQSLDQQGVKNATMLLKTMEQASDEAITQATADALLSLSSLKEEKAQERERQAALEEENKQKEIADYWNGIKGIISKGNLKDLVIPDKEREQFFNYLAVPINNLNQSQEMVDEANEDDEFRLMVSYLRYKKYNLSDLINLRVKNNRLENMKKRLAEINPKIESSNQARHIGNNQSLSLDTIL